MNSPKSPLAMHLSPRCSARSKRTGEPYVGMDQGYGTFRQASGMKWGLYAGNDSSRNDDPDT